ncbi:MAG: C_GCAxxG_C_C family protein, partial [Oscillospiraceae bacterium]|nr:C_GCAxxG_C_C family protein [Oscillospiraceae bacterium]
TENDPERKAYTAKLTKEFLRRFSERFQNLLDCRDLLQAKDLQGVEEVATLGAAKHCETLIISAVAILYDYLEELEEE